MSNKIKYLKHPRTKSPTHYKFYPFPEVRPVLLLVLYIKITFWLFRRSFKKFIILRYFLTSLYKDMASTYRFLSSWPHTHGLKALTPSERQEYEQYEDGMDEFKRFKKIHVKDLHICERNRLNGIKIYRKYKEKWKDLKFKMEDGFYKYYKQDHFDIYKRRFYIYKVKEENELNKAIVMLKTHKKETKLQKFWKRHILPKLWDQRGFIN